MGFCAESTPEMGEYSVEIRSNSFFLRGEDAYDYWQDGTKDFPRHSIWTCSGTAEIELEDISKIRACLDLVESHLEKRRGGFNPPSSPEGSIVKGPGIPAPPFG